MKQKIILIASVVIGLLAAVLTRSYMNAKDNEVELMKRKFNEKNKTIEVIAVKKALPSGTVLSTQDLGTRTAIEASVRGHCIKESQYLSLIGRKTLRALPEGALLFWSDVEGGDPAARGIAGDIKPRMRAVSVNATGAAAVSGMVKPNDHVDVLGTFSFPSKTVAGELELVTLTIMQDVLVLATGKETAKSQFLSDARSASGSYSTVTLEVTPREGEMLVFLEQMKGRISLALRNPDDIYFEKTLPRVNFEMIQAEIESLNTYRQQQLLRKRSD